MDASELAQKLLDWENRRRELDIIEHQIKEAVLELGKTQSAGNVRATFTNGRKAYDWAAAGQDAPRELIVQHTSAKINWRSVCKEAEIEDVPFIQSAPSVSIRLV